MNKKRLIIFILIICIIGIVSTFYVIKKNNQIRKSKEQIKEEEIERLNEYFKENYNYYIQEIAGYVSVGPRQVSVEELIQPRYFLVKNDGMAYSAGIDYFCFPSKDEAQVVFNKLKDGEKEKYYLISQSIMRVPEGNEKDYNMLQEAQTYFKNIN